MQNYNRGTHQNHFIRTLGFVLFAIACCVSVVSANDNSDRHYYGGWNYHPKRTYYYSNYYYKPQTTYSGYKHHYSIYYPSRPRYVYYYNPVARHYWGRYDLKEKGYSLLAEKDRKDDLTSIPEEAFPDPGTMPAIPESNDGEKMLPIDPEKLPGSTEPSDIPKK
jgi:hypothetical protein